MSHTNNSIPSVEKKFGLYVKISPNRAADLVIKSNHDDGDGLSRKSINPLLVVSLNKCQKKTSRKLATSQPSWHNELEIPLIFNDYSQVLILTVWDKHSKYKNYLGEVRISLRDLFYDNSQFSTKSELKWYKMYSNMNNHSYVTGSLLVSFELIVKKKKLKRKDKKLDNLVESIKNVSLIDPHTDEINLLFDRWYKSLVRPRIDVQPDDQGFYNDIDDISNDMSDIESIETTRTDIINELPLKKNSSSLSLSSNQHLYNLSDDISSLSDASIISSDGLFTGESDLANKRDKKSLLQRAKRKKRLLENWDKFQLSNRQVLGVIFIEIISCKDLPPLKNLTRTSFDVDPFVVVTFGKKTFRTAWKRHNLNPIFNERLAFEIEAHEKNFDIQFSVLDMDRLKFHDKLASVTLPMSDITGKATAMYSEDSQVSYLKSDENLPEDSGFSDNGYISQNSVIKIIDDENNNTNDVNQIPSVKKKKKKFPHKPKVNSNNNHSHKDLSMFKSMNLSLNLDNKKYEGIHKPELLIRVRFETYDHLRRKFWRTLLEQYQLNEKENCYDYFELISLLDTLGSPNSDELVVSFYEKLGKSAWGGDLLTHNEIIDSLEDFIKEKGEFKLFEFDNCPLCLKKRLSKKDDMDIITHVAICASKDWSIVNKLVVSSYVSPQIATKKWFSKVLIKLAYGKYALGGNSANILVQDRLTGIIMEEKMGVYVRLGIRLLYKGLDQAKSKRVRSLLRKLSIKQGSKFDMPSSVNDIGSFIKFHKLDLSDCLEKNPANFKSFNDFFYRKLKPGARPLESPSNNKIATSPADCRCTAFTTVTSATELWIKGKSFTVAKLFNGNFEGLETSDFYKADKCTLGIFRLAPQDYHRFHSPVDGVIKSIKYIEGEYYTVNPMAIRSELDVFGENIRSLIAIETEHFGTVVMVAVGAMMVGSTVLTKNVGDKISRGEEVGYFKFGGSTILLLFEKRLFSFDSDLINNSKSCVETLIRVGQSIGHSSDTPEYERHRIDFHKQSEEFKLKLIRVLTGGDIGTTNEYSNWESSNIKITDDDVESLSRNYESQDEDFDLEGDSFDEEGSVNSDEY
ncbi:phosphatidylserine decarboxylase-domain-containing protein [Scheffersomyces amazonensis]|uniref:phosphatidylserine decarboxylase-domain-containing protein n=1 Tax=Scheffersomyces amazonensis TaxID=1078765 RepID=UPI00315D7997